MSPALPARIARPASRPRTTARRASVNRRARRTAILTTLTVALSGASVDGALATPSGAGPGNSTNVHQCYRDGWRSLVMSSGQAFASQAACVSYAASGGVVSPRPAASLTVEFGTCTFAFEEPRGTRLRCLAISIIGSGLMPGAAVIGCDVTLDECVTIANWVEADGTTLDSIASFGDSCLQGHAYTYTTTTAAGSTIQAGDTCTLSE